MKKKIITAVLGICLTTTAFGGILTTQAGDLAVFLVVQLKLVVSALLSINSVLKLTLS